MQLFCCMSLFHVVIENYLESYEDEDAASQYGRPASDLLAQFFAYLETCYADQESHHTCYECDQQRLSEMVVRYRQSNRKSVDGGSYALKCQLRPGNGVVDDPVTGWSMTSADSSPDSPSLIMFPPIQLSMMRAAHGIS